MPTNIDDTNLTLVKYKIGGITTNLTKLWFKESPSSTPALVWETTPAEWHTIWAGSNYGSIEPDGTQQTINLSNVGTIPNDALFIRVSGILFSIDEYGQDISLVPFQEEISRNTWTKIAELQDRAGSSEARSRVYNSTVETQLEGTCYYPDTHVLEITSVEVFY